MLNPNNLKELSNELENILDSPISIKILEQLTEKQRNFLTTLIHKWSQGEEVEKTIKNILDFGKTKLKPREYSDKTKNYLENKLK
jgi:16S rRNA U1498 N3-methylase RsmE